MKQIAAFMVFALLASWWLVSAQKKPMGNDELYSQVRSIQGMSYAGMIGGKIDEGNITPLFYLVQKAWQDLAQYRMPEVWIKGQWDYNDPFSNVFLRIPTVIYMAAAVAVIAYYFCAVAGWLWGLYALLISLSSFMVWSYVLEARPYALWFLLSALQMITVLSWVAAQDQHKDRYIRRLGILTYLLAFTVVFSVIQNFAVCVLLWIRGYRRLRMHVVLFVVPAVISSLYYIKSPKYQFWFNEGFMGLLGASLPVDRMAIIVLAVLAVVLGSLKWFKTMWSAMPDQAQRMFWSAILVTGIIWAGCWAVLLRFKSQEVLNHQGFQVSNRYFMVLAAVGIIATGLSSLYLTQFFKGYWKKGVIALLMILLLFRLTKILPFLIGSF